MKPCRTCINFYIKSFSRSTNTLIIYLRKPVLWMVECYTAPPTFYSFDRRYKYVESTQVSGESEATDISKLERIYSRLSFLPTNLFAESAKFKLQYSCEYTPILDHAVGCFLYLTWSMFLKDTINFGICSLWK